MVPADRTSRLNRLCPIRVATPTGFEAANRPQLSRALAMISRLYGSVGVALYRLKLLRVAATWQQISPKRASDPCSGKGGRTAGLSWRAR